MRWPRHHQEQMLVFAVCEDTADAMGIGDKKGRAGNSWSHG